MRRQWKPIRCLQLYTYSCIHIKKITSMASSPKKSIHTSYIHQLIMLKDFSRKPLKLMEMSEIRFDSMEAAITVRSTTQYGWTHRVIKYFITFINYIFVIFIFTVVVVVVVVFNSNYFIMNCFCFASEFQCRMRCIILMTIFHHGTNKTIVVRH